MQPLPESLLTQIAGAIAAQMGLHFPPERWRDLERSIRAAARDLGLDPDDAQTWSHWLSAGALSARQIEALARHLTVGETYFFRDQNTFDALRSHVLPALIQSRLHGERSLRIWSAGCATGEEPYSIAILLDQLLADWNDWQVTLLATDINRTFLQRAAAAVYRDWSFRGTFPSPKGHYFREGPPGRFALLPSIKERVRFQYLNLAADDYPSPATGTDAMDIIFCRNVLIYFSPRQVDRVLDRLEASLVEGGWLVVSPGEGTLSLAARFEAVEFPGAILYRKKPQTDTAPRLPVRSLTRIDAAAPPPPPPTITPPPQPLVTRSDTHQGAQPHHSRQQQTDAKETTNQALETNSTDPQELLALARTLADRREHDKALNCCEQAIAADKLNPFGYYLQAVIHQEQGRTEAAARALKHALYLDPKFVMGHFALGNVQLRQGHIRQANRHFANTLELLDACPPHEIVPESHGLTAARLADMIRRARHGQSSE